MPLSHRQAGSRAKPQGRKGAKSPGPHSGRAFTLLEWLICLIIIGILLSLATSVFRGAAESSVMAQARNAIITYAQVARNYAVANHIETMLVVNPYNGRFEVWYSNPPPDGGPWSPLPSTPAGTPDPANLDSYAFAPILDPAARLPLLPTGEPAAGVCPIDYGTRAVSAVLDSAEMDNLTWAAFCFDQSGQLVVRTRRIATRSFYLRSGLERTALPPNRLRDETPDLTLPALIDERDTPITSSRGFVIFDLAKAKLALGGRMNPQDLVGDWLTETRGGGKYYMFARTIVLNRFSGQQLTSGAP